MNDSVDKLEGSATQISCGRRDNENPGSIGLKNGLFKEIAKGSVRLVEAQEPKIEKLNLGSG